MATRKPSLIADIIREYLLKYPLHSKKNLAKLLYSERPMLFKDVEYARSMIRYYTGNMGDIKRKSKTAYYDELRKQI